MRYSPAKIRSIERTVVRGEPDPDHISTSYVEAFNLSTRLRSRRFTRLTNGFSRKIENHRAAASLHLAHHNLCWFHSTIRCTRDGARRDGSHLDRRGVDWAALNAPEPTPLVPHRTTA